MVLNQRDSIDPEVNPYDNHHHEKQFQMKRMIELCLLMPILVG
jgi:hypothetical protein